MKTKLYLLTLLLCAGSLLSAQRNSILPRDYSSAFNPSLNKPHQRPDRLYKSLISRLPNQDAIIRSAALEQLDSILIGDTDKIEFAYDNYGYLTSFTVYFKEFSFADWDPFLLIEYDFSPEGHLLQEISFLWSDDINGWEAQYREDFTYLTDNNLNDRITYMWDAFSMEWTIGTRTVYTYLPDNRIDLEYFQNWNPITEMWTIDARAVYNYDIMNRLEEVIRSWYEPMGDNWMPYGRETYQYNTDNLIVGWGDFYWNGTTSEWIPVTRINYSYNAKGELILETFYDFWNMVWTPGYRETFDYDAYGNMTRNMFSFWDEGINTFLPEDRMDFEYDVNTPVEDIYFPHIWDGEFIFNHKMVLIRLFSYYNDMWEEDAQADFYYAPIMTSTDNEWEQDVRIYPNPASDHLVLQLPSTMADSEVTLLHVSGQPVLHQAIAGEQTVLSIQDIPSGMYMLQYRSKEQGVVIRPLIIHR